MIKVTEDHWELAREQDGIKETQEEGNLGRGDRMNCDNCGKEISMNTLTLQNDENKICMECVTNHLIDQIL